MRTLYSTMICVFMMLISTTGQSQIENLNFSLVTNTTTDGAIDMNIASTIEKNGNTLTWTQYSNETGSSQIATFAINNVNGTWTNETSIGDVLIEMSTENTSFEFSLIGTATGIEASIRFITSNSEADEYIFETCTITYL